MFNVNDTVVYGNTGVCHIEDIRLEDFLGKKEMYYILKPIYSKGSMIFCPVENAKTKMRKTITKKELDDILSKPVTKAVSWIENDNERRSHFSDILKRCDVSELYISVISLSKKENEKLAIGKKLHATDEKFLSDFEKILYGEIAFVLDIPLSDAIDLFKNSI